MSIDNITDVQLQNFTLNQIEEAYMLKHGLYTKEDLLGQPYFNFDYPTLREHVRQNNLPSGYYKLCKMFCQEELRGVKVNA